MTPHLRILAAGVVLAASAHWASAATDVFGSYARLNVNGAGNVWYGGQQPGSNYVEYFDGKDLGDIDVGQSIVLSGGQLLTWKGGTSDVTGAWLNYRVYEVGDTPGGFTGVQLSWSSNGSFQDAAGNTFTNGSDQRWDVIASTPDLAAGLPLGNYEIEVYWNSTTNEGDRYSSNGGANYTASFSVVPEPASLGLLGLSALGLRRRRR